MGVIAHNWFTGRLLVRIVFLATVLTSGFGIISQTLATEPSDKLVSEEEFSALFESDPAETIKKRGLAKVPRPGFDVKTREATTYVLFETGSIMLKGPESFQQLVAAGRAFKKALEAGKADKWLIEIASHTDNVGSPETNMKLSQERAESVRQYLLQTYGLPWDMVTAYGYGEAHPIASNDTSEGREKNRRVVFRITQRSQPVVQVEKPYSTRTLKSPCGPREKPYEVRGGIPQDWLEYPVPVPEGTACIIVPRTMLRSAWEQMTKHLEAIKPLSEE